MINLLAGGPAVPEVPLLVPTELLLRLHTPPGGAVTDLVDNTAQPPLTPQQNSRGDVARGDSERVRNCNLSTTMNATLLLELGALVSSLHNVLQVVEDLAVGEAS